MRLRQAQSGFTLIELMIAGATSFFLVLVCVSLLEQSADLRDGQQIRLRLNAQARQAFSVLSEGGALPTGATGSDGTRNIYGLRGLNTVPGGTLRQNYRLNWTANGGNAADTDSMAGMQVTCRGPADPLPDCTTAGTQKTVTGWMGANPVLNTTSRSVGSKIGAPWKKYTVETTITVTDPHRAVTAKRPAEASDTYRNIFTAAREGTANP